MVGSEKFFVRFDENVNRRVMSLKLALFKKFHVLKGINLDSAIVVSLEFQRLF